MVSSGQQLTNVKGTAWEDVPGSSERWGRNSILRVCVESPMKCLPNPPTAQQVTNGGLTDKQWNHFIDNALTPVIDSIAKGGVRPMGLSGTNFDRTGGTQQLIVEIMPFKLITRNDRIGYCFHQHLKNMRHYGDPQRHTQMRTKLVWGPKWVISANHSMDNLNRAAICGESIKCDTNQNVECPQDIDTLKENEAKKAKEREELAKG
jgi:hypothetical protein